MLARLLAPLLLASAALAQPTTLPAAGDAAPAALAASTRHGEYVDVKLADGMSLKMFVVYPERPDRAPVVLVIHEIFGLTDWVRSTADALAAEGFVAVAPDLLSGKGPGGGGTEAFAGDEVRNAVRALAADEVAARLDAARAYATALPAASGKVGVVGFCWGGTQSFAYAARQPALGAAVVYYGSSADGPDRLAQIAAPVLGHYGANDARVTNTVEATTAAMKQAGKLFEPIVHAGAGHGFLRQQAGEANAAAARAAWGRTITFLKEKLEG